MRVDAADDGPLRPLHGGQTAWSASVSAGSSPTPSTREGPRSPTRAGPPCAGPVIADDAGQLSALLVERDPGGGDGADPDQSADPVLVHEVGERPPPALGPEPAVEGQHLPWTAADNEQVVRHPDSPRATGHGDKARPDATSGGSGADSPATGTAPASSRCGRPCGISTVRTVPPTVSRTLSGFS